MNERGYCILVARCIDHCLNLVFVAFLEPFESKFALGKLLRSIRGYIKSGGGHSRRATLAEHAISISGIDFTLTRWTSFLKAVIYVMSPQSKRELKMAREQLQLMAEWGDESAKEALKEDDVARLRWDELYSALESMGQDEEVRVRVLVGERGWGVRLASYSPSCTPPPPPLPPPGRREKEGQEGCSGSCSRCGRSGADQGGEAGHAARVPLRHRSLHGLPRGVQALRQRTSSLHGAAGRRALRPHAGWAVAG